MCMYTCVYILKLQTFTSHYLYNANKILIKTLMTLLIILISNIVHKILEENCTHDTKKGGRWERTTLVNAS